MHTDFFVKETLRHARRFYEKPQKIKEGEDLVKMFYPEQLTAILYCMLEPEKMAYVKKMANEVLDKEAEQKRKLEEEKARLAEERAKKAEQKAEEIPCTVVGSDEVYGIPRKDWVTSIPPEGTADYIIPQDGGLEGLL